MAEPVYILVAPDGHITLYWGDGTEPEPYMLWRGPLAEDALQIAGVIEELTQWAEEQGYTVVVPAYEQSLGDVEIDLPERDARKADPGEIDQMLDDLYVLGDNEISPYDE